MLKNSDVRAPSRNSTAAWEAKHSGLQWEKPDGFSFLKEKVNYHLDGIGETLEDMFAGGIAPGPRFLEEISTLLAHLVSCVASIIMVCSKNILWHGLELGGLVSVELTKRALGVTASCRGSDTTGNSGSPVPRIE